jgi:enamine deaminase RidA (YjgF/YER057c/UK114 family)
VAADEIRRLGDMPGVAPPLGAYMHAVVAGPEVHVAGQVAVDPEGRTVGRGDFAAQARQVYRNLEAVLAAAGCGWERVLKLTVYLTDMANLPAASRARTEAIPAGSLPASTVVQVERLADPDWMIEVDAVARLPEEAA